MTTEKSPRSRFDVSARAKEAEDTGEASKSLADISHAASLDEETNIPGTDPVPRPQSDGKAKTSNEGGRT